MATKHEIIGEEWKERASDLAEWAMQNMVNRKDVWGQYSVLTPAERIKQGRSYKAMTLPRKDMRGDDMVLLINSPVTLLVDIITNHKLLVCMKKAKRVLAMRVPVNGSASILTATIPIQSPLKITPDVT